MRFLRSRKLITELIKSGSAMSIDSEGHTTLRGGNVARLPEAGTLKVQGVEFQLTARSAHMKRAEIDDFSLYSCNCSGVKFFNARISNCQFDQCNLSQIGFWDSRVEDCTFIRTDFRDAAFGGINFDSKRKNPNIFRRVQFEKCDFRGSSHSCEVYEQCTFNNCNLHGVMFFGAVFIDCTFRGHLEAVEFNALHFLCKDCIHNRLDRCDFQQARLHDCIFRNLSLNPDMFGSNPDSIWLRNGKDDLTKWYRKFPAENFFIQWLIEQAGTPTFVSRNSLVEAAFTPEQIQWLVDIAGQKR